MNLDFSNEMQELYNIITDISDKTLKNELLEKFEELNNAIKAKRYELKIIKNLIDEI